ncbi:MAG: 2-C-methyl-D-erythritol 4-phosphate cytidylyltransferase [Chitinophagales bacterium]
MYKKHVIIAAAGFGTRMNSQVPKQFLLLAGTPVIVHTIKSFLDVWSDAQFIIALPDDEFARWEKIRKKFLKKIPVRITKGGATRFHSVKNALKLIREDGLIAVQDACRPFVSGELLMKCEEMVREKGNAVPAIDFKDSIREMVKDGSRNRLRQKYKIIQTPQCFSAELLKKAYKQNFNEAFTDDASVVELTGIKINLVEGDQLNFKITTPFDLRFAENIILNDA